MKRHSKVRGFTLLELVAVLGILAILLTIAVPRFQAVRKTAERTAHNANVRLLKNAGMLYLTDHPDATEDITAEVAAYLEGGKMPKPAKSCKEDAFTVSVIDDDIVVNPGEITVSDNSTGEGKPVQEESPGNE